MYIGDSKYKVTPLKIGNLQIWPFQFGLTNGYEMMHKAWSSIEEVLYFFQGYASKFEVTQDKKFWSELSISGLLLQFEFTDHFEITHKAWCCLEEVPIIFRSHPSNF